MLMKCCEGLLQKSRQDPLPKTEPDQAAIQRCVVRISSIHFKCGPAVTARDSQRQHQRVFKPLSPTIAWRSRISAAGRSGTRAKMAKAKQKKNKGADQEKVDSKPPSPKIRPLSTALVPRSKTHKPRPLLVASPPARVIVHLMRHAEVHLHHLVYHCPWSNELYRPRRSQIFLVPSRGTRGCLRLGKPSARHSSTTSRITKVM